MADDIYSNGANIQGEDSISEEQRKPGLIQAAILYSFTVIIFLVLGSRIQQHGEFYSGVFITEYLLILLPSVAFLLIYRYDIKKTLRLNRVRLINIILVFGIMIFALPVVGVINLANLWIIKQIFGKVVITQIPAAQNLLQLLAGIFIIGITPAICEETMFRGVMQRGFERIGAVKAILLTAFLFGMMHVDFQKLLGTFLLGALIGFIVYRTNSLIGGMLAHFTNNTIAVFITYISAKFLEIAKSSGIEDFNLQIDGGDVFSSFADIPKAQMLVVMVVWAFIILFCAAVLAGLLIVFVKNTTPKVSNAIPYAPRENRINLLWILPGVILITLRYVQEGMLLLGIDVELFSKLLKLIGL